MYGVYESAYTVKIFFSDFVLLAIFTRNSGVFLDIGPPTTDAHPFTPPMEYRPAVSSMSVRGVHAVFPPQSHPIMIDPVLKTPEIEFARQDEGHH